MKIGLLGDVALFGKYSVANNAAVREYMEDAAEYLGRLDYVVGNLETPFVDGLRAKGPKSAYIKADTVDVELLKYLNIRAVNLANNHLFDYGIEGYRQTLATLDKNGIDWFGVEGRQLELVQQDAKIVFHGYCSYNTNPLGISNGAGEGINPLNLRVVAERLRSNHARGFLNVVSVHSGQEHVNYPSRDDIRMARQLAEICPYVYYGHHPHVLQGLEQRGESLIAYSLGNFCFDDVYTSKSPEPLIRQSLNNRQGAILELDVSGGALLAHRVNPLTAGSQRMEIGSEEILSRISEYSEALAEPEKEYEIRRREIIDAYLADRKRVRDLRWYLNRLNFNSVGIVARARYNRWQYRRNVSRYLHESTSSTSQGKLG